MSGDNARLTINILFLLLFPSNCVYSETTPIQSCETSLCITRCCPNGTHIVYKRKTKMKSCSDNKNVTEPNPSVFEPDLNTVVDVNVLGLPDLNVNISTIKPTGANTSLLQNGSLVITTSGALASYVIAPSDYCMTHILTRNRSSNTTNLVVRYFTLESAIKDHDDIELAYFFKLIAWLISSIFIAIVLVVYSVLEELRNLKGMMLMSSIGSLMMAFLLLSAYTLISWCNIKELRRGCVLLTYFFIMATFFWINTMSIDVWWTFRGVGALKACRRRRRRKELRKYRVYSVYAWGLPLLMNAALIILDEVSLPQNKMFLRPNLKDGLWTAQIRLFYLDIPILILLAINALLFVLTVMNISFIGSNNIKLTRNVKREKTKFWLYFKLSVTMGINWLLEILSAQTALGDYYIADIFNGLIGVIIFIIFVGKKSTWKKLVARYHDRNSIVCESSHSPQSSGSTEKSFFREGYLQKVNNDPQACTLNEINSMKGQMSETSVFRS